MLCFLLVKIYHQIWGEICQDGRVVDGAAFRSQSTLVGVGANPTSDIIILLWEWDQLSQTPCLYREFDRGAV